MNYGKRGIKAKHHTVPSKGGKWGRKFALIILQLCIVCVLVVGVIGTSAAFGIFKGIIARTESNLLDYFEERAYEFERETVWILSLLPDDRKIDILENNDIGLYIGPKTISLFQEYIKNSKTIIWNGPVGMFEREIYANGTKELCRAFDKDNGNIERW